MKVPIRATRTALEGSKRFWFVFPWGWRDNQENALDECPCNVCDSSSCDYCNSRCSAHMEEGGKKDAEYVALLFEEKVEEFDPKNQLTNVFFFDGASNVQKAGNLLMAKYPCTFCFHGGEHVVLMFFSSIAKIKPIKVCMLVFVIIHETHNSPFFVFKLLILKTCKIYNVFGSGANHGIYAQFMGQSSLANGGKRLVCSTVPELVCSTVPELEWLCGSTS